MALKNTRDLDDSVLGDSWVVESPRSKKGPQRNNIEPASKQSKRTWNDIEQSQRSDMMMASSSSFSGPELIMPSICETSISDGSWVAPNVRSRGLGRRDANRSLESRKGSSAQGERVQMKTRALDSSVTSKKDNHSLKRPPPRPRPWRCENILRLLVNLLLTAGILHLLVLPELFYQYQSFCSVPAVIRLYPSSCAPRQTLPLASYNPSAGPTPMPSMQTRLKSILNTTLTDTEPLGLPLKNSESRLRDLYSELKTVYPGARHELELEFQGCLEAVKTASKDLDSLRLDIRSAFDSLVATDTVAEQDLETSIFGWKPKSDVAKEMRQATQTLHRRQYLDQLTSNIRSKAGSLTSTLATVDDYLESIERIVDREERQATASHQSLHRRSVRGIFRSLFSGPPKAFESSFRATSDVVLRSHQSGSELLHDAVGDYRLVAAIMEQLSEQLVAFQRLTSR
ncbi:hypothetical protein ASPZODRAFT_68498 [Penicilliopsis zonata CBS 506.65]|uniref:Uncharacterized protein n=1 Tax=Penicilliopsis zonata CBS 506.65 TaxID=1073090 RepID=A0A1L9SF58_9EURO|nr:hypothetical protein ASPZODRAFT_68498 [Penicilliopsis zonata CBS 506.65]OJJ45727.1 hypothetical protein ASPZODRAFT_68498 [Penicilliopsis zonata CBS 506.65]